MANCPICGKDVQADATFCPSCGSKLQQSVPAQSTDRSYPQPQQLTTGMTPYSEERLMYLVKRLERVTYITAAVAVVLLALVIYLLI